MKTIKINHLAIHVSDLNRSMDFYGGVLGLQEIEEPFHDGLHTWYEIGDGISLHLIEELELKVPADKSKTNHLCFSLKDLDAFIQKLRKINHLYGNWEGELGKINFRSDGIRQIFFQDPDGYWLEANDDF
ncbi:VOC family protein [Algoriphagus sp. CAU 1675]|uniref:VOC family protein n=1 Tax=Algoriphagus sp. CAU 1675 TaxID=3032597 RepID=UPI0023DB2750|nr:VOC family protein [Algoriphagus sp. CAU 1675]MDF2156962.1 VOC family protein [Algoriphagus sp. CAU 1675]